MIYNVEMRIEMVWESEIESGEDTETVVEKSCKWKETNVKR